MPDALLLAPMAMTDDDITTETRVLVARARERAAMLPAAGQLVHLALSANEMTPQQVRDLAATTLEQAQEMSYLLGKLAGLLGDGEGDPRDQG